MTIKTSAQHGWRTKGMTCIAAGILLGAAALLLRAEPAWSQKMAQPSVRNLSGTITDTGREPIRNAVVELRNTASGEVVTYLTDASGHYNFKRLNGNVDYEVWVQFRGIRSPTRSISKFDSHMAKVIDFTVRTY
ncbi:MAG TPA: carboxypeptidase-like regulatory domain-containing protein [Acidobacteriaceae bacterium]